VVLECFAKDVAVADDTDNTGILVDNRQAANPVRDEEPHGVAQAGGRGDRDYFLAVVAKQVFDFHGTPPCQKAGEDSDLIYVKRLDSAQGVFPRQDIRIRSRFAQQKMRLR
jgi:hypothetical protein